MFIFRFIQRFLFLLALFSAGFSPNFVDSIGSENGIISDGRGLQQTTSSILPSFIFDLIPIDVFTGIPEGCQRENNGSSPFDQAVACVVKQTSAGGCFSLDEFTSELANIPSLAGAETCDNLTEPYCSIASSCESCQDEFQALVACYVLNSGNNETDGNRNDEGTTDLTNLCSFECSDGNITAAEGETATTQINDPPLGTSTRPGIFIHGGPTPSPTVSPTASPVSPPTQSPSIAPQTPTPEPTSTYKPTITFRPTSTKNPTYQPTISVQPTISPEPTYNPTISEAPTYRPTVTFEPTYFPTEMPFTEMPLGFITIIGTDNGVRRRNLRRRTSSDLT